MRNDTRILERKLILSVAAAPAGLGTLHFGHAARAEAGHTALGHLLLHLLDHVKLLQQAVDILHLLSAARRNTFFAAEID